MFWCFQVWLNCSEYLPPFPPTTKSWLDLINFGIYWPVYNDKSLKLQKWWWMFQAGRRKDRPGCYWRFCSSRKYSYYISLWVLKQTNKFMCACRLVAHIYMQRRTCTDTVLGPDAVGNIHTPTLMYAAALKIAEQRGRRKVRSTVSSNQ